MISTLQAENQTLKSLDPLTSSPHLPQNPPTTRNPSFAGIAADPSVSIDSHSSKNFSLLNSELTDSIPAQYWKDETLTSSVRQVLKGMHNKVPNSNLVPVVMQMLNGGSDPSLDSQPSSEAAISSIDTSFAELFSPPTSPASGSELFYDTIGMY